MTTKHTPEPWRIDVDPDAFTGGVHICGDSDDPTNGAGICGLWDGQAELSPSEQKANAMRIVACVNACAGMSDDDLETFSDGSLKSWIDEAEETLEAVCNAVEDVDYSGRCEHGIYALKQTIAMQNADITNKSARIAELNQQRDEMEKRMQNAIDAMNNATREELSFKRKLIEVEQQRDDIHKNYTDLAFRLTDVEQQRDELMKDKARIDWLADPTNRYGTVELPHDCVVANLHSLRAAIDAAMELTKAQEQR